MSTTVKERYMGEAPLNGRPDSKLGLVLKDGAVTTQKIADGAVTLDKIADEVPGAIVEGVKEDIADLQNQIDSIVPHGVAVSNRFGNDTHISISQKTLTGAINDIWTKLEEITGENVHGIKMAVNPEYFIGEAGCDLQINASSAYANGKFEIIEFFIDNESIGRFTDVTNVSTSDFDPEKLHITDTCEIKCFAQILGQEYTLTKVITRHPDIWVGAGDHYSEVMIPENLIEYHTHLRTSKDVTFNDGDSLFIIMGNGFLSEFIRLDMNGFEIAMEGPVAVPGENCSYFMSERVFEAGTYNIDING